MAVGQMAHIAAVPAREGACPMRLVADWLWFRDWLARCFGRDGRVSAPPVSAALFVGVARARFCLRMAASRIAAARKKGLDSKTLSLRKGCACLYVMNGMACEGAQELGGWESPAVMESVYTKGRSGEVAPEMTSAVAKACNVLEVVSFVEVPDRDVGSESDGALGLMRGAAARIWLRGFTTPRAFLVPEIVIPIRDTCPAPTSRRVRPINLTDSQRLAVLLRATEFRLSLKSF